MSTVFGSRLLAFRKDNKITRKQLAKAAGVAAVTVERVEVASDLTRFHKSTLNALMQASGINLQGGEMKNAPAKRDIVQAAAERPASPPTPPRQAMPCPICQGCGSVFLSPANI